MLTPQFYSQLTVCPTCQGWGNEKPGKDKKRVPCRECGGLGIFLIQTDQTFIWSMPTFIDFSSRKKMFYTRITVFILTIVLFLILYYLLTQINIKIPSYKLPTQL